MNKISPHTHALCSRTTPLAIALTILFGGPALQAQVVVMTAQQTGANVFAVSNTDLFQTNLNSVSTTGGFQSFAANIPSLLFNGDFGPPGNTGAAASVAPLNASTTITFSLDLSVNTAGYTVTQLVSFASWDGGRDGQEYTVAFSTAAAPNTFSNLITIPQFQPPSDPISHTRVVLTDQTGILASGVAAVRYTFTSFEANGTAYREIDAIGFVTVPEPSSLVLIFTVGVGRFAWCRRRPIPFKQA